jgi:hypothetical protein
MRTIFLSVVAAAYAATPTSAQQQRTGAPIRGAQSRIVMLRHPAIQDELKLSDEQKKKVLDAFMKMRDQMLELIENGEREKVQTVLKEREKDFGQILTPEQTKRLKQVYVQVLGLWALTDAEVMKEIRLTQEQQKKVQDLQQETEKEMNQLFGDKGAATRSEAQKKAAELHKSGNDKGLALLSAEQQAKWKEIIGEPFKGEIPRIPPISRPSRP